MWRAVEQWVAGLADVPWREPSKPLSFPEGQPTEIREVDVLGTSITITYEHHHKTSQVALLLVAAEGS